MEIKQSWDMLLTIVIVIGICFSWYNPITIHRSKTLCQTLN